MWSRATWRGRSERSSALPERRSVSRRRALVTLAIAISLVAPSGGGRAQFPVTYRASAKTAEGRGLLSTDAHFAQTHIVPRRDRGHRFGRYLLCRTRSANALVCSRRS